MIKEDLHERVLNATGFNSCRRSSALFHTFSPRAPLSASVVQMCFNVRFFLDMEKDRSDLTVNWPQTFKGIIGKLEERRLFQRQAVHSFSPSKIWETNLLLNLDV